MSRRVKKKPKVNDDPIDLTQPVVEDDLYDHLRPEVKAKQRKMKTGSGNNITYVFIISIIIIVGLIFSGAFTGPLDNQTLDEDSNNDQLITDIADVCVTTHNNLKVSYWFILQITLSTGDVILPTDIGVGDGGTQCMKGMHTHLQENRVYIEYNENYIGPPPTLGDFFRIWGQPLSSTQLMGETGSVDLLRTVNQQAILKEGDPTNYVPVSTPPYDYLYLGINTSQSSLLLN